MKGGGVPCTRDYLPLQSICLSSSRLPQHSATSHQMDSSVGLLSFEKDFRKGPVDTGEDGGGGEDMYPEWPFFPGYSFRIQVHWIVDMIQQESTTLPYFGQQLPQSSSQPVIVVQNSTFLRH